MNKNQKCNTQVDGTSGRRIGERVATRRERHAIESCTHSVLERSDPERRWTRGQIEWPAR